MISSEQLGAWAQRPEREPETPTAKSANARLYSRVSPLEGLGSGAWQASHQASLSPAIDLSASAATFIWALVVSRRFPEPNDRFHAVEWHRENLGPTEWDADSIDYWHRDAYHSGSLSTQAKIGSAPLEGNAFERARMRAVARTATERSAATPYVSVIWSLVEAQQLRKARALLKLVPDAPEYARLKKLLSTPVSTPSPRQDFDRSAEYAWLSANAKDYVGKWVAVSGDSLVAVADTLRSLREEVRKARPARVPLLHFVE
jgi:hypothetical protein